MLNVGRRGYDAGKTDERKNSSAANIPCSVGFVKSRDLVSRTKNRVFVFGQTVSAVLSAWEIRRETDCFFHILLAFKEKGCILF